MGKSALRGTVSSVLIVLFPLSLFAADTPSAMLYSHGTASLNGDPATRTSAIFQGDLIQTSPDSVVNLTATGSTVMILNDSLVQYEGTNIKLEHGGVNVSTSKSLATRAGSVVVAPATCALTEFEVRDVDGIVRIAAWKGELTVRDPKGTTTLAQGQQTIRDEGVPQDDSQGQSGGKKKEKKPAAGTVPGAAGGYLNSPLAIGVAGAIAAGGAIWVLTKGDNPVSPAKP